MNSAKLVDFSFVTAGKITEANLNSYIWKKEKTVAELLL